MLSVLLLKSLGLKRNGFTANIPTLVQTIIILNPPFTIFSNQITTTLNQGQTGRVFQLRVGAGSGIEQIFRVGLGIGYLYQTPSQLGIMGY